MNDDAITIRIDKLEDAVRKLNLPEAQRRAILQRAVSAVLRWASGRVKANLVKHAQVPREAMKYRVFTRMRDAGYGNALVWIGLNPIRLKDLHPQETGRGVTAGPVSVPGGFIAIGGHVFRRKGRKRLPIEKVPGFEIEDKAWPFVFQAAAGIQDRLLIEFEKAYLAVAGK